MTILTHFVIAVLFFLLFFLVRWRMAEGQGKGRGERGEGPFLANAESAKFELLPLLIIRSMVVIKALNK
jgi:hypothetical protein